MNYPGSQTDQRRLYVVIAIMTEPLISDSLYSLRADCKCTYCGEAYS